VCVSAVEDDDNVCVSFAEDEENVCVCRGESADDSVENMWAGAPTGDPLESDSGKPVSNTVLREGGFCAGFEQSVCGGYTGELGGE